MGMPMKKRANMNTSPRIPTGMAWESGVRCMAKRMPSARGMRARQSMAHTPAALSRSRASASLVSTSCSSAITMSAHPAAAYRMKGRKWICQVGVTSVELLKA